MLSEISQTEKDKLLYDINVDSKKPLVSQGLQDECVG